MVKFIVQHEVLAFATWKVVFDADETNRAKLAIKIFGVFNSVWFAVN